MKTLSLVSLSLILFVGFVQADKTPQKTAPVSETPKLTEAESQEGFKVLFDGQSLKGWQGAVDGYEVKDGILAVKEEGGNLFTDKEYANFVFRFEFKLASGGNNGIGIRSTLEGDPAYKAMEIQVLDDTAPEYANLLPAQYHGSIYKTVVAKRGHLKPLGQWNVEEIKADGGRITVTLNGVVITDADVFKLGKELKRDNLLRTTGYIGFLGHGPGVEFRNVRIKPLER